VPMILKFGRKSVPVASLAEASAAYSAAREASGKGGSKWPSGIVFEGGRAVAHVSYNGRVWAKPSRDWTPGDVPLFDNRAGA
jgi:hypothetical protein